MTVTLVLLGIVVAVGLGVACIGRAQRENKPTAREREAPGISLAPTVPHGTPPEERREGGTYDGRGGLSGHGGFGSLDGGV